MQREKYLYNARLPYMARLVVKNRHQNDTGYNEIGIHGQNTILGSIPS